MPIALFSVVTHADLFGHNAPLCGARGSLVTMTKDAAKVDCSRCLKMLNRENEIPLRRPKPSTFEEQIAAIRECIYTGQRSQKKLAAQVALEALLPIIERGLVVGELDDWQAKHPSRELRLRLGGVMEAHDERAMGTLFQAACDTRDESRRVLLESIRKLVFK